MEYVSTNAWLETPLKCPECGGIIVVDIFEWETESRKVTEGGFHAECKEEDEDDYRTWHTHDFSDWLGIQYKVMQWLDENIRVECKESR